MNTQAVILAGGKGTRLWPLTKHVPKPMISVAGEPFLKWQIKYLQSQGFREVVLLIAHLGNVIEDYFNSNPMPGMSFRFVHEPEPLGTGGALKNAAKVLQPEFWLINGDSFLPLDFKSMTEQRQGKSWTAQIASLVDANIVGVPGNLRMEGGVVHEFKKGSEPGLPSIDAGVYWISRSLIEKSPAGRFDLEALWPDLIREQKLGAFPVNQRYFDIGTPERLKVFEERVHDYF